MHHYLFKNKHELIIRFVNIFDDCHSHSPCRHRTQRIDKSSVSTESKLKGVYVSSQKIKSVSVSQQKICEIDVNVT